MTSKDRVRWDTYFRKHRNSPLSKPDPLLLQWTPHINDTATHRALDAASGQGQNGIWLAEQGYIVDFMDVSRVALARTRAELTSRNLRNANLLQTDFDDFTVEEEAYDIVCVFRYLHRGMIPQLKASLVPGGRFIYETFNMNYLDLVPEFNQAFLLQPGELESMFHNWTILYAAEAGHISQLVAVNQTPHVPDEDDEDDTFAW